MYSYQEKASMPILVQVGFPKIFFVHINSCENLKSDMAEIISLMMTNYLPAKSVNNNIRNEISRSGTAPVFVEKRCLHCREFCHRQFDGNIVYNIGMVSHNFKSAVLESTRLAPPLVFFHSKNHKKAITII